MVGRERRARPPLDRSAGSSRLEGGCGAGRLGRGREAGPRQEPPAVRVQAPSRGFGVHGLWRAPASRTARTISYLPFLAIVRASVRDRRRRLAEPPGKEAIAATLERLQLDPDAVPPTSTTSCPTRSRTSFPAAHSRAGAAPNRRGPDRAAPGRGRRCAARGGDRGRPLDRQGHRGARGQHLSRRSMRPRCSWCWCTGRSTSTSGAQEAHHAEVLLRRLPSTSGAEMVRGDPEPALRRAPHARAPVRRSRAWSWRARCSVRVPSPPRWSG